MALPMGMLNALRAAALGAWDVLRVACCVKQRSSALEILDVTRNTQNGSSITLRKKF